MFQTEIETSIQRHHLIHYGDRRLQVLHVRLRTECSALKYDLFRKNIVTSPLCACGSDETVLHFFLECTLYTEQRRTLLSSISPICEPTLGVLLFGNQALDNTSNKKIIDAVHLYIDHSGRFPQ